MTRKFQRRELLIGAGVSAAAFGAFGISRMMPGLSETLELPERGFILTDGRSEYGADPLKKDSRRKPIPASLMILNTHGAIVKSWSLPFSPHGVQQSKANPNLIVAVQKTGEHFAVIDPREKEPIKIVRSKTEMNYFGHGAFTADGKLLGVTGMHPDTREGYVALFETKNFEPVGLLPLNGSRPHELQLDTENLNCFIVASGGGLYNSHYKKNIERHVASQENPDIPKLVWLNWKTGFVEKVVLSPSTDMIVPGHFTQLEPGKILVYGATTMTAFGTPSLTLVRRAEETFECLSKEWPSEYAGETLNAFLDVTNNRFWLALPDSHRIVVADARTFKVVQEIGIREPRSMTQIAPDLLAISSTPMGERVQLAYSLSRMEVLDLEEAKKIGGPEIVLDKVFSAHTAPFRRA